MSCSMTFVRSVEDADGEPCPRPAIGTCGDCGDEFCIQCSDVCVGCGQRFCEFCLKDHACPNMKRTGDTLTKLADLVERKRA